MNEEAYDVVVIDCDPTRALDLFTLALRVVRVGGLILVPHVLWKGETSDPTKRGAVPTGFRKIVSFVGDAENVMGSVTPLADGLLTVVKVS